MTPTPNPTAEEAERVSAEVLDEYRKIAAWLEAQAAVRGPVGDTMHGLAAEALINLIEHERSRHTIPLYGMLDLWMALANTSHPGFDEFYAEHGYAETWARLLDSVRHLRRAHGLLSEGAPSEEQIERQIEILAQEIHEAWVFQYDECDHGYYRGGHLNGEPYSMCRISSERIVRRRAAAAGVAPQEPSEIKYQCSGCAGLSDTHDAVIHSKQKPTDREKLIARLTGSINPLDARCGECGAKPGKRCYGNGEMRRPHPSREMKAERELRVEAADALAALTTGQEIDPPSVREAIGEVLADMEAVIDGVPVASDLVALQEITDAAIQAATSPPSRTAKRTGYETVASAVGEHSQKITARAALSAPQEVEWEHGVIGGDDLLARLMDTLAYYHCRSVNPKADSPYLGYHAMSEDQREFLREKQREAAEEVLRMWHAESRPPAPQEGDARDRLDGVILDHVLKIGLPIPSYDNRRRALCTCGEALIYEGEYIALSWHRDHLADAILAAFPVLSRDIAGEIEAEADESAGVMYTGGLRRAAEIVRNGR